MGNDAISIASALIETGNVDTIYRDVYVGRARTLLNPVVSVDAFHGMEQRRAALASLPLAVARAMEKADWPQVKELSLRTDALKQEMSRENAFFETARGVYAVTDVKLDPFCQSLQRFSRVSPKDLPALRTRIIEQLTMLEQSDVQWKDFYAGRRAAFETRAPIGSGQSSGETSRGDSLEENRVAAAQALKAGDMKRLGQLAELLVAGSPRAKEAAPGPTAVARSTPEPASRDLVVSWPSDTVTRARQLGLAPRHLEPKGELAALRQYAWNPLSDESHRITITDVSLPPGSPAGLRDRLEVLMIHPFANSGGARHLPSLVAEDVLVEDFPDPAEGEKPPASPLLTMLKLDRRRGLSRAVIEGALLEHGSQVLEKELGLDPRVFRLVCIPSDVHFRLGEAEGWGRKPFWTHFDGYLIRHEDGQLRLQALAGGDVRYGGLYDILGVGRDDDSESLLARFAVVHRERMVAW
jgi:hypothetical protein